MHMLTSPSPEIPGCGPVADNVEQSDEDMELDSEDEQVCMKCHQLKATTSNPLYICAVCGCCCHQQCATEALQCKGPWLCPTCVRHDATFGTDFVPSEPSSKVPGKRAGNVVRKGQGKGIRKRTKQVSKRAPQLKRPKRKPSVQKKKPATDSDSNDKSNSISTSCRSTSSSGSSSSHVSVSSG